MRKVILLVLLFFVNLSFAQPNLDSLKSVWYDGEQPDSTRLKAVHGMVSEVYLHSNPDSAFYFAKLEYDLAEEIDDQTYMIRGLNMQSFAFLFKSDHENFIKIQKQIVDLCIANKDSIKLSKTLNNIGSAYTIIGDYPNSIDFLNRSLVIREQLGDQELIANGLSNLGRIYMNLEDFESALNFYRRSLKIHEQLGDSLNIAFGHIDLGILHYKMGNSQLAFSFLKDAISALEQNNRMFDAFEALIFMGNIYKEEKKYDLATQHYQRAKSSSEERGTLADVGMAKNKMGEVNKLKGDSAQLAENPKLAQRFYDQALTLSSAALQTGIELQFDEGIRDAALTLSALYRSTQNYKASLEMYELYIAQRDSLINQDNKDELIRRGYQYDYEKQKLTDDLLHENELKLAANQRYALYVILIVSILISLVIYSAWSSRKKLSIALEASYAKLQELNEYKESMTAMLNHDLRSPLTLIIGYISRILSNEQNYITQESEDDLRNLEQNSLKLIEMSEEIQELLLLEEGRLQLHYSELDINEYVKVHVSMFSSIAEEAKVTVTFDSNLEPNAKVRFDQSHIDKVIYNLMTNAIRYTDQGGKVHVSLLEESATNVSILIADNGKGIAADHLPQVFERNYKVEGGSSIGVKNYGIGLAVVKELVELHGGQVSMTSKESVGTTVKVILPYNLSKPLSESARVSSLDAKYKELPVVQAKSGMVGSSSEKPIVLVVDDHEEIRNYISELIGKDYQVKKAANGRDALKKLAIEKVDLIITDLMMPWLDGFGLIDELKKLDHLKNIPVMVISARTNEEDRLKILDHGINNFMSKPFHPNEFKKRISNILMQKEGSQNTWDEIVNDKDILSNVEQDVLKKLNQIITTRIDDPSLTIDLISNELNASRSKTIKLIKTLTDKTPLAYIKGIRMDYVDHLIKSKKIKNASEAAQAIGMKNVTQFTQQYQKHFDRKPF